MSGGASPAPAAGKSSVAGGGSEGPLGFVESAATAGAAAAGLGGLAGAGGVFSFMPEGSGASWPAEASAAAGDSVPLPGCWAGTAAADNNKARPAARGRGMTEGRVRVFKREESERKEGRSPGRAGCKPEIDGHFHARRRGGGKLQTGQNLILQS